jgi:hypothetical protein
MSLGIGKLADTCKCVPFPRRGEHRQVTGVCQVTSCGKRLSVSRLGLAERCVNGNSQGSGRDLNGVLSAHLLRQPEKNREIFDQNVTLPVQESEQISCDKSLVTARIRLFKGFS